MPNQSAYQVLLVGLTHAHAVHGTQALFPLPQQSLGTRLGGTRTRDSRSGGSSFNRQTISASHVFTCILLYG